MMEWPGMPTVALKVIHYIASSVRHRFRLVKLLGWPVINVPGGLKYVFF